MGAIGGSRVSTLFDSEKGEIRRNDTRDEILSLWLQCVCKGENSYKELILFVTFVAIAFIFITQRIFSNVHTWKTLSVLQASHVLCNVCDTRYRRKDCWVREMVTSTQKNWAKNCFLSWTVIDLNSSGCESIVWFSSASIWMARVSSDAYTLSHRRLKTAHFSIWSA